MTYTVYYSKYYSYQPQVFKMKKYTIGACIAIAIIILIAVPVYLTKRKNAKIKEEQLAAKQAKVQQTDSAGMGDPNAMENPEETEEND
jgi:predicted small secreted protein